MSGKKRSEENTLEAWGDIIMNSPSLPKPGKLTDAQRERAIYFMKKFGGSFVSAMAEAYIRADSENRHRLEYAFPEYFKRYANFPGEKEG